MENGNGNKRTGKRMNLRLRAKIKDNGKTRTIFFEFPKQGVFDRPINVFYNTIAWFRALFVEIDEWAILRALQKTNSHLADKMMDFFVEKVENGDFEKKLKKEDNK